MRVFSAGTTDEDSAPRTDHLETRRFRLDFTPHDYPKLDLKNEG